MASVEVNVMGTISERAVASTQLKPEQLVRNALHRRAIEAVFYDRATHGLVRGMTRASRSSQSPGLQINDDRSVDIYFGPAGSPRKESNWVPTSRDGEFEVLFRFYGPEKSLFEKKTWRLPDIEKA